MGTAKRERQRANRQLKLEQQHKQQVRQKTKKRTIQIVVGLVLFVAVAVVLSQLIAGGDDDDVVAGDTTTTLADSTTTVDAGAPTTLPAALTPPSTTPGATITGETPCPPVDGSAGRTISFEQAPPTCIDPAKTYTAEVTTNKGTFTIALDAAAAPQTVNNFVVLSRYGFYDGVVCHRILSDFAVQCGDPTGTGTGGPGYTIPDELPAEGSYQEGSIAMANTGQPDTGGSQFFIIVGPEGAALPAQYALFGQVTDGYDTTVAAMEAAAGDPATNGVPPTELILIESIRITEA